MTLKEMSEKVYRADERFFDERIVRLRGQLHCAVSQEERRALRARIGELRLLRRQSREVAEVTGRYYERGYHRDERYTL